MFNGHTYTRFSFVALGAGLTLSLNAGSAYAQNTSEYQLHIIAPLYDISTSESRLDRVLDSGLAWGSSTVLTELPSGNFSVTYETVTWSLTGVSEIVPINAINERGDRVIESPNLLWATVEYADGGDARIDVFTDDVALWAWDLNQRRMVVGASLNQGQISHGILRDAFYWTPDLGIVNLKTTGLVPNAAQAWSVNDSDEIVGIAGNGLFDNNQAFYFDTTTLEHVDLHSLLVTPGQVGVRSDAYDINSNGVVVGSRDTGFGGDIRAFLWSKASGPSLLPAAMAKAQAINDSGVIVGGKWRYSSEAGLVDLNTLTETSAFTIVDARDISNTGIIVGWGHREGSSLGTAFMLVPNQDFCAVDLNADGATDFFDISIFIQDQLDWNNDSSFDFFDISAFLSAFSAGCP